MPIYEYKCKQCGETFEEFQNVNEGNEKLVCPSCGTTKPERIMSAFASAGGSKGESASPSCSPTGFS